MKNINLNAISAKQIFFSLLSLVILLEICVILRADMQMFFFFPLFIIMIFFLYYHHMTADNGCERDTYFPDGFPGHVTDYFCAGFRFVRFTN